MLLQFLLEKSPNSISLLFTLEKSYLLYPSLYKPDNLIKHME